MTRKLALMFATAVAVGAAPQIALACTGDACNAVTAGAWSNGRVTVTDKDTSGKISVKVCFKNSKVCNPWGINPGANSVALSQPKPPVSDTTVEIVEATYSQKPTKAASYVTLSLTNGTAWDVSFGVHDDVAKQNTQAPSDVTKGGSWSTKALQTADGFIDVTFSNVIRTKDGSYYRCLEVKTQVNPGGQWSHTFTENEGRKC